MESRNPRIAVPCPNLPPEIVEIIGKSITSEIDICRFRAVCRSWRSSKPPYRFPTIKLPFPLHPNQNRVPGAYFVLTERVVYRIQLPESKDPDFWLVKVEHAENGRARILHPVTHRKIEIPPGIEMRQALNILDPDVSEVCKAHALRYVDPSKPDQKDDYYDCRFAKKAVLSANRDFVVVVDFASRLWRIRPGEKEWTRIGDQSTLFYDVAIVKGQVRATDSNGGFWAFDSSSEWKTAFCCTDNSPSKRRLVELYNGELVLVEEMVGGEGLRTRSFRVQEPVLKVGIYKLSIEVEKWVDAKAMYGCIIVVGDDCSYSVPTTQELKAARVFFMDRYCFDNDSYYDEDEVLHNTDGYIFYECDCRDVCRCLPGYEIAAGLEVEYMAASEDVRREFEGVHGHNIGVCDFETGDTGTALMFPQYAAIFWPPPAPAPAVEVEVL